MGKSRTRSGCKGWGEADGKEGKYDYKRAIGEIFVITGGILVIMKLICTFTVKMATVTDTHVMNCGDKMHTCK